jgi:hypothetical protein
MSGVSNDGSSSSIAQPIVTTLLLSTIKTTTLVVIIETSFVHPKHIIIPKLANLAYKQEKAMQMIISFVKDKFISKFSIEKEDSQEVWELLRKCH